MGKDPTGGLGSEIFLKGAGDAARARFVISGGTNYVLGLADKAIEKGLATCGQTRTQR